MYAVTAGCDTECAAIEINTVIGVNAVIGGFERQCAGTFRELNVIVRGYGMFVISCYRQIAVSREYKLPFTKKCGFPVLIRSGIRACVAKTIRAIQYDEATFFTLVIDGRTIAAAQCQLIEYQLMAICAVNGKLPLAITAQQICDVFDG